MKKVEEIEYKVNASRKKPNYFILFVSLLCISLIPAIYIMLFTQTYLPKEQLNESQYRECNELFNSDKDKHTLRCCDTCNMIGQEYAYDIQYQQSDNIIDRCVCVDSFRLKVNTVWG